MGLPGFGEGGIVTVDEVSALPMSKSCSAESSAYTNDASGKR